MLNYNKIPVNHMINGVVHYVEDGLKPGDFLRLVLENDFVHAFAHADIDNMAHMKEWAAFLYHEMPMPAWGSKERVQAWIDKGGLNET